MKTSDSRRLGRHELLINSRRIPNSAKMAGYLAGFLGTRLLSLARSVARIVSAIRTKCPAKNFELFQGECFPTRSKSRQNGGIIGGILGQTDPAKMAEFLAGFTAWQQKDHLRLIL
jgi:hypothetical protein